MSGREKPLILQNGVPIPQAYDKDLGDWTEYSTEHIKAIKAELALVKAELQTIKANQLSGDQKVTLSGTIVELAQGGPITITAGTEYVIYSTTNFDASEVTVQVRGNGQKVDIVIKEYINSIAPSKMVRASTISSAENTAYLMTGRTKVFGRILEIYVKNTLSGDALLSAWAVNAIKI